MSIRRRLAAAAAAAADGTTTVQYLYSDGQSSHPVKEYLPGESKTERGEVAATITPSFVLDVTWPRVAVFYHPNSAVCQDLTPKFVELARSVRHVSSRVPVSFHAVSCQVHPEVCEEFGVKAVPVVLAFKTGRVDGTVVRRNDDNTIDLTHVADVLELTIAAGAAAGGGGGVQASGGGMAGSSSTGKLQRQAHLPQHAAAAAAAAAIADANIDGNSNSESSAVYADAASAFLTAMEQTVYDPDGPPNSSLDRELTTVLRDFLDLLHWSLPSQWKLHDLINDLRTDYDSVIRGRDELLRVLYRHHPPGQRPTWSPECSAGRYVDPNEAGGLDVLPEFGGYTCGLLRLFHISAAGVARQHGSVYGERDIVRPAHIASVLRDYVESFYGGSSRTFRRIFLDSVDKCRFDLCGRLADVRPDTKAEDPGWTDLSLWLWNVHNEVRRSSLGGGGGRMRIAEPWPSAAECPNCRRGTLGSAAGGTAWDDGWVYEYLDRRYWPQVQVQNPRIVVIKPWGKRRRFRRLRRLGSAARGAATSPAALLLTVVVALAVGVGWFRTKWENQRSGWHKKSPNRYEVGVRDRSGGGGRRPVVRRRQSGTLVGGRAAHSLLDA